ncbi:MAG: aldo/keto reductase [Bacteroidia bacterium]|nr:aldo/keto reductase [Bacteroidia bacterium]
MKYKRYTNNTPLVSEIGLGAWQLGENSGWKSMSEKEAMEIVGKSLEYGINFFDTAPVYGHGTGETRLGKALKGVDRNKIVINTKFGRTDTGAVNFDAAHIRESLEGSLRRLQTDYIDSLIIHNPPFEYLDGHKNDHYEILERLVDEGKIRAYGASIDSYDEMMLLMNTTNSTVIEAFFNILHQDVARAFDTALKNEVGIIVKIPLDSGWLTGKYHAKSTFTGVRSRWTTQDIETRSRLVDKVKSILNADSNLTQKAISFCLAYDAVSTVIPGAVDTEQLQSNIESINNPLTDDLKQKLEVFYQNEVKQHNLPW